MKQLILFKNIDVKQLDGILTEISHKIYDMKHFALHQEISSTSRKAFNLTLELARNFAELGAELSDLSFKYNHMGKKDWERLSVYNPYYPALEPRSSFRLLDVASNYKSRSNAILLRLEACLKSGAIKPPTKIEEIKKNLEKVCKYLKDESTQP